MALRRLVAVWLLLAAWGTAQAQSVTRDALLHDLRQLIADEHLAGAVYATVIGDAMDVGAVGSFDVAAGIALREDSKVQVGSISKTMLALAVLRLVSEGRVDLEAPVETLLPVIRFENAWASRSPVRLRHLLDHSSGLEDLRPWHMFSERTTPDLPLLEVFRRSPGVLRVRTEPGTRISYSNLGYTLAAMVVEATVHEAYEVWADREILPALGMRDSSFAFKSQRGPHADARLAWGHLDDLSRVATLPIAVRPAGQFTTTARDMAQLARFLISDGIVDGQSFIRADLLRAMGTPTTTIAARAGLRAGYALGLSTRDRHGAVGLCHAGSVTGFRAMLCVFPAQAAAFFVANNTDSETATYGRFDERLARQLGVTESAQPLRATRPPPDWDGRYVLSPSRFESLALLDVLGSSVSIRAGPTSTSLTPAWGQAQQLGLEGNGLYRLSDRVSPSHVFLLARDGERGISDGSRSYRRVSSIRYGALWCSVMLGVGGLTYWLLWVPARRIWRTGRFLQPALVAAWLLVTAVAVLAVQSWTSLGDITPGSVALYAATVALPTLMLVQAGWSLHRRAVFTTWRSDLVATLCVLQFCLLLYVWGMLPLALWS